MKILKTNKKAGISLIVLVITIIVAIILTTTIVINTSGNINDAKITSFATELNDIEDAVESFYVMNGDIPKNNVEPYTKLTLMNLITDNTAKRESLSSEITENKDNDAYFYELNLASIGANKFSRGNKTNGDNTDTYVIAFPSLNVYYVKGIKVSNKYYFSITSQISNISKIEEEAGDTSTTEVVTSGGIKVTKNKGYTDKLGINITTDMSSSETLYMSVCEEPTLTNRKQITTTIGNNTFGFNKLSNVLAGTESLKVTGLSSSDVIKIEGTIVDGIYTTTGRVSDRYVYIAKYSGSELIAKVKIDLNNYSNISPTVSSSSMNSYATINTVTLNLAQGESDIKEIRYMYLNKFSESGTLTSYYSGMNDIDKTFLISKGKRAIVQNNKATIKAPKNVQGLKIAVIDKAGNSSIYNQQIAEPFYPGYTLDGDRKVIVNIYTTTGLKTVNVWYSSDGITYPDSNKQTFTANKTAVSTGETISNIFDTALPTSTTYVKIEASNYAGNITVTRTIAVNVSSSGNVPGDVITTIPAPEGGTVFIDKDGKNVPVPKGFAVDSTLNVVSEGLVITDTSDDTTTKGNQFVWVPVNDILSGFTRTAFRGETLGTTSGSNYESYSKTEGEYKAITNSIKKYGGFYVGRFEAGIATNMPQTAPTSDTTASYANGSYKPVSKKNVPVWNYIQFSTAGITDMNGTGNGAVKAAHATYNNKNGVYSTLLYPQHFDTILNWMLEAPVLKTASGIVLNNTAAYKSSYTDYTSTTEVTNEILNNSSQWGNYLNDSKYKNITPVTCTGILQKTGSSENYSVKSIYDLAGNVWEWNFESNSSSNVSLRAGCFYDRGHNYSVSTRHGDTAMVVYPYCGFRLALYIN